MANRSWPFEEGRDGTIALPGAQLLHDGVVAAGEEPDWPPITLTFAVELRRHRAGMTVLDAIEAQHHGHVGLQRRPELLFSISFGVGMAAPV